MPSFYLNPDDFFQVKRITLDQLLESDRQIVWLDARKEKNYRRAHIPGATLLNEENYVDKLFHLIHDLTPEKIVVVYCDLQFCDASQQIALQLQESYAALDVYILEKGWRAWKTFPQHKKEQLLSGNRK